MTDAKVIKATYHTWRPALQRKKIQVVFEVEMEQQGEVLEMLGPPLPDRTLWVAIAKMGEEEPQAKPKSINPVAQKAALLCDDLQFQLFLFSSYNAGEFQNNWDRKTRQEKTADLLRDVIGVKSRADIQDDEVALEFWNAIQGHFELYKRGDL